MRFDNKVAIITGAGAGMGKAAALGFTREGAHVYITDILEERLESVAREIRSAGGRVTAIVGDATKSECPRNVVGKALEQSGRIDILYNYVGGVTAGVSLKSFLEDDESIWDGLLNLNLMTTLRFTKAALGSMVQNRYGKIINTGSGAGKTGAAGMTLYTASKGAIIAFTKSLAREVAKYNINVNCVCPGLIATPTLLKSIEDNPKLKKYYEDTMPIGRIGRPEEIASAVMYLASDDASFITGQAMSVDGGQVMM